MPSRKYKGKVKVEYMARGAVAALCVLGLLAMAMPAAAGNGDTDGRPAVSYTASGPDLAGYVPGEVVVKLQADWEAALSGLLAAAGELFQPGTDYESLKERQAALAAPFLMKLELRSGLEPAVVCEFLSRLPMVEMAEPNYIFRKAETTPDDTNYAMQWNLRRVGASQAWDIEVGSDAFTIAVIDTGVDYNGQEFTSRCVPGYDYYNKDPDPYDDDVDGHGTTVASVMGAATNNANMVAGMTWAGKIMPLKALNFSGEGTNESVSQSLYHAANNGARIINMSFTSSEDVAIVREAVAFAYGKGCLMTAAVGNEGTDRLDYPAAYDHVIGVGSVDFYDNHSSFSNHNSSVDLVAPGQNRADDMGGIPVVKQGNVLKYTKGTSIAAPHVAGAALLIWADDPTLTSDEVWQSLRDGALDLGATGWDEYYGFGRLDVMKAMARIDVTILSPDPYSFDPAGNLAARAESLRSTDIQRLEMYVDGTMEDTYTPPSPYNPVTYTFTAYDFSSLTGEGGHQVEVRALDTTGIVGSCVTYYFLNNSQPRPSSTWYLAEGTTSWGFDTWVLIQNPNENAVTVNITYMKPSGPQARTPLELPAASRTTIHLNAEVPDSDVSTYLESSGGEVIAERSMYWNNRAAGHDSIGVNAPSSDWYLAEGTTAGGFEEYVLIQNPNSGTGDTAHVTLEFMRPDGSAVTPYELDVAPASRKTVSLNQVVPDADLSVHVSGDLPVICERAMYWNSRSGGHDSIGTPATSRTWYLAEGTTAWGFEEFVLVQNPDSFEAEVDFTFTNADSQVTEFEVVLPAFSRYTLNVADVVGEQDVSTFVYSDTPLVCERAMYWKDRTEGHASVGSTTPAATWYLAEGSTDWGFEEWVLVSNPTDIEVQITLTCMLPGGGTSDSYFDLPARSRFTVDLSAIVGATDVSVMITSDTCPVITERAMYWGGRTGGTGSIGVFQP